MDEKLVEKIEELDAFPILPDAALELIELANSSQFLFKDMVSIIERDPAIAANVLKAANSDRYGKLGQVSSINQASDLINTTEMAELVLNSVTSSYFATGTDEGYVYLIRMRDHSVLSGRVARLLAEEMGQSDGQMLFLSGLIHDIGFLLFARHFWDSFSNLVKKATNEGEEIWGLEKEEYGVNHAFVGAAILEKWNFPETICGAVKFHHNPWDDTQTQEMSTIVHFANFLSHYMLDKSGPFELKKRIDKFLHSRGADLVEKHGFELTSDNFVKLTDKLEERTKVAG